MSLSTYLSTVVTEPAKTYNDIKDGFTKLSNDEEKSTQYLLVDLAITLVVVVAFKAIASAFAAFAGGLVTFAILGSYQCWKHGSTFIGRAMSEASNETDTWFSKLKNAVS